MYFLVVAACNALVSTPREGTKLAKGVSAISFGEGGRRRGRRRRRRREKEGRRRDRRKCGIKRGGMGEKGSGVEE